MCSDRGWTASHAPLVVQDGSQEVPQYHLLLVLAVHQDAVGLAPAQEFLHPFPWAALAASVR